jgi:hypothetical protein
MSTIYYYLRGNTNEFIGEGQAQTDSSGVKIIPPEATIITPPTFTAGTNIPIFDSNTDTWSLVDDFRGQAYYDTATDTIKFITTIDTTLPASAATQLETNKFLKKQEAYANMDLLGNVDVITVASVKHHVNPDNASLYGPANNTAFWNALPKESGSVIAYVDADFNTTTLNRAQAIAVNTAIGTRTTNNYTNFKTLVTAIDAAASQAALDAVDITAGWVLN